MTVLAFPDPFWLHVHYRCRRCGETVLVSLGNGYEPPREGFYTCGLCSSVPVLSPARLALVEAEGGQLELGGAA